MPIFSKISPSFVKTGFVRQFSRFKMSNGQLKTRKVSCYCDEIGTRNSSTSSSSPGRVADPSDLDEAERNHYAAEDEDIYPPIIPPLYEHDFPAVIYEKENIADFLKLMPTAQEKVDHVNPFERDWTKAERRRRRDHDPEFYEPRKSFLVPAAAHSYNMLPLYKHITRTHTINGLPQYYDQIKVNANHTTQVSKVLQSCIEAELHMGRGRGENKPELGFPVNAVIDLIVNTVMQQLSGQFEHLRTAQVSRNIRTESFWLRGGFHSLYDEEMYKDPSKRMINLGKELLKTDDRRVRGELSFCAKEQPASQIRTELPLPQFADISEELSKSPVEEILYRPELLGLEVTSDNLFMVPGYELDTGDPREFGHLCLVDSKPVYNRVQEQLCDEGEGELEDSLTGLGLMTCFNWLNGVAHSQGFNQYNDLLYPLTTQALLTNGNSCYFVAFQLNSLGALMKYWETDKMPSNLCWSHGPVDLYSMDRSGRIDEWNEQVVEMCLKFFLNLPEKRNYEMKPYIEKKQVEAEE